MSEEVRTRCHLSPVDPTLNSMDRVDVFYSTNTPSHLLHDLSSAADGGAGMRSLPGAVSIDNCRHSSLLLFYIQQI